MKEARELAEKILEYASLDNTEFGEFAWDVCQVAQASLFGSCDDLLKQEIIKDMKSTLKWYQENTKIVMKTVKTESTRQEIEFIDSE